MTISLTYVYCVRLHVYSLKQSVNINESRSSIVELECNPDDSFPAQQWRLLKPRE